MKPLCYLTAAKMRSIISLFLWSFLSFWSLMINFEHYLFALSLPNDRLKFRLQNFNFGFDAKYDGWDPWISFLREIIIWDSSDILCNFKFITLQQFLNSCFIILNLKLNIKSFFIKFSAKNVIFFILTFS